VRECPCSVNHLSLQIIIGISACIIWCAVSYLQIEDVSIRFIYELVSISCSCLESSTHARRESGFAIISVEGWCALKDVDELILLTM